MMTMQNEFSTASMRAVWNDKNRVAKICDVERTLAIVQGEMGIIPVEAAEKIAAVCRVENVDMRKLYLAAAKAGHFISGFVAYMQELLGPEAGEYIHFGVTTQDIFDTGIVLQLKDAHKLVKRSLVKVTQALVQIAAEHKGTVTAGRAHGNHAVPTTVGYKAAIVLNELDRHLTRLDACEDFVFSGVIASSVGTYAAWGEDGKEIERRVLNKLGLAVPEVFWHTQRDRYVEYCHLLAMVSGTLGKVGQDLFDLSRSEIREFEEPYAPGRQGSTAMPTMRNPYMSEAIVNLAQLIGNEMTLLYGSMRVSHEKDTMAWRNQWVAIPEICMYLSAQLNYAQMTLQKGTFLKENIARNLYADGGMLLSERLMIALSPHIGKQTAHALLYGIANEARNSGRLFSEVLQENTTITAVYTAEEIAALLDPHTYVGVAVSETERILTLFHERHG